MSTSTSTQPALRSEPVESAGSRISGRVLRAPRSGVSIRVDPRSVLVGLALLAGCVVVSVVALSTGDFHLSPGSVVRTLFGAGTPADAFIVRTLRLPRVLAALLVGAALGIGGALFQSLTRNALGSPDVVGFTTGAATGALLEILVFGGSALAVSGGSLVGGFAAAVVVYVLAYRGGVQGYRLVLVGLGIAAVLTSVNSFLLTRADLIEAQQAAVWLTGSLNGRSWDQVEPMAIALAVLAPLAVWAARDLRMLELGDDTARALGVHAERSRVVAMLAGVALTAAATATAGPIGFVALAAPQLARRLTGATGPGVVPAALMGALLLSVSDLGVQRLFGGSGLPVGVATGAVGGLYLGWLLFHEWRKGTG